MRVSFLVVDAEGAVVTLPTARVWVANALDSAPFLETEAKLERIGVPGRRRSRRDATSTSRTLQLPRAGKYWLLAEPEGGAKKVQALGNVVVVKEDAPPDVGDPAIASETPTLASTGGDVSKLTTRTPPDEALLRYSVADSLAGEGAVRRDVRDAEVLLEPHVRAGRRRRRGGRSAASRASDVRFIHVEVYEGNDPAKGYNRWMQEWRLPTEPWTFLVGRRREDRARFEGTVSVNELEQAVRASKPRAALLDSVRVAEALDHDVRDARHRAQRSTVRTSSTMSSGGICSSSGSPVHSVIRVATNPGEIAVARTPCSASSRLSEFVNEISAAFVAP